MSLETQFGQNTEHGLSTLHRVPNYSEQGLEERLLLLVDQLYPTGRAFYHPSWGNFENLHRAINMSFIRVVNEAELTVNKSIPDNLDFKEQDALLWEYRLGITIDPLTSLENKKKAIRRKMAFPSNIKARQHPLFLESQLQLAGFDVWIHENRFEEDGEIVYKTPDQISASSVENVQYGDPSQYGRGTQFGSVNFKVIANQETPNENYSVGGYENLWSTFFIAGNNLTDTAEISINREIEFRELVLKLKPAHTTAFLLINFL